MFQTVEATIQIKARAIEQARNLNAQSEDTGEIDGFKITVKQCNAINMGERWAVDKFFEENNQRLKRLAKVFLQRSGVRLLWDKKLNTWQPAITEISDCLNQLYVDMRRGFLIFALVPHLLSSVICYSFRYAGVGGFGDDDGVYIHRALKRACNVGA